MGLLSLIVLLLELLQDGQDCSREFAADVSFHYSSSHKTWWFGFISTATNSKVRILFFIRFVPICLTCSKNSIILCYVHWFERVHQVVRFKPRLANCWTSWWYSSSVSTHSKNSLWLIARKNLENNVHSSQHYWPLTLCWRNMPTCPIMVTSLPHLNEPHITVSDECAKYAIRKTLLLSLHQTSTNQVCSCGKRSSVLHHLVCKFNGKLRTFRTLTCWTSCYVHSKKLEELRKKWVGWFAATRYFCNWRGSWTFTHRCWCHHCWIQSIRVILPLKSWNQSRNTTFKRKTCTSTTKKRSWFRWRCYAIWRWTKGAKCWVFESLHFSKSCDIQCRWQSAQQNAQHKDKKKFNKNYKPLQAELPGIFKSFILTAGGANWKRCTKSFEIIDASNEMSNSKILPEEKHKGD